MKKCGNIKILISDDHRLFRQILRTFLQSKTGMLVVGEAENGQVAVRKARELHPDVILMDVSMPVLGGADATRQIKHEFPKTLIIALSNQTEDFYIREMLDAGAADYLVKSAQLKQIERSIRETCSKK